MPLFLYSQTLYTHVMERKLFFQLHNATFTLDTPTAQKTQPSDPSTCRQVPLQLNISLQHSLVLNQFILEQIWLNLSTITHEILNNCIEILNAIKIPAKLK